MVGCELSTRMKKIREAVRAFLYGEVDVFKCFCPIISIFFVTKQPYSSSHIELLLLSVHSS